MIKFNEFAIIALLAGTGAVHGATTVFEDNFSNGLNKWYFYNGSSAGLAYDLTTSSTSPLSGSVMRNNAGSTTNSIAIAGFSSVALTSVGDTITLSFDYRIATASGAVRVIFGLYNSGEKQVTTNQFGVESSDSADDSGYSVLKYLNDSTSGELYSKAAGTGNQSLNSATTKLTTLASTANLLNNSVHHIDFTITRVAEGLQISLNIDNTGVSSYTVTSPLTYTFNEIGLSANPNNGNSVVWDNVTVTANIAPIPEPAALSIIGTGGMCLLSLRHKK